MTSAAHNPVTRAREALAVRGGGPRAMATGGWTELVNALNLSASSTSKEVARPMEVIATVFRAIRLIAQTVAGFPVILDRGEGSQALTRGPAFDLLAQPCAGMTTSGWLEQWTGHYIEGGEAHVLPERGAASGRVRRLPIVGYRQMTAVRTVDDELAGWLYTRGGKLTPLAPELDAYTRQWGPHDAIRGLSALRAAALGIQHSYHGAGYTVAPLVNGCAPGGLLVFPVGVGPDEAKQFTRDLVAQHQGQDRAFRLMGIGGGVDYKETSWKSADMELLEGLRFSREDILVAFGVPGVLLGIFEAAHYDVFSQAFVAFLTLTIQPIVTALQDALNLLILPQIEPGVRARLDTSKHPVMQELSLAKIKSVTEAVRTGIPYNAIVEITGLPLQRERWGDTSLMDASLAPAEEVVAGLAAPPETEGDAEEEEDSPDGDMAQGKDQTPARRTRGPAGPEQNAAPAGAALNVPQAAFDIEARREERQIRAQMPAIRTKFRVFWLEQERALTARLRAVLGGGQARAARSARQAWERADASDDERTVERVLLKIGAQQERLGALVARYFPRACEETLRAELKRLKLDAAAIRAAVERFKRGEFVKALVRAKLPAIRGMELTTRRTLRRELLAGLGKQETVQDLTDRIHAVLGGNRARALTVARTEAGQAVSAARFVAARVAGATGKGWVAGNNPRPTHAAAGQRYAPRSGPIAMSGSFVVGNDLLMYPRDPTGSAGEIINCNCYMVTLDLVATPAGRSVRMINVIGAAGHGPQAAEKRIV